jgi:hypothetical protein
MFSSTEDAVAESKLKFGRPVPETEATVTDPWLKISLSGFDRHATVVAEDQDDVKHTPRSP